MHVDLLLCDHAEAANGKLYVNGGGWSILFAANRPATIFLAIVVTVDWSEIGMPHEILAELVTIDEEPVLTLGDPPQPTRAVGRLEIGQPFGIKPGTPLPAPMALGFGNLVLEAGHYLWRVTIDPEREQASHAEKTFQVVEAPQLPGFPPRMP